MKTKRQLSYIRFRECEKKSSLKWSKANPEKKKAVNKAWYIKNSDRAKAYSKSRYQSNPKAHLYYLTRRYNLQSAKYEAINKAQNKCCAICGTKPLKIRLAVDHCHKTGKVRGLLCHRCNAGIGFLGDNPKTIKKALTYLLK